MKSKTFSVDTLFLIITGTLLGFGLLVFLSASLSLLGSKSGELWRILLSQIILGLCGGIIGAYIVTKFPLKYVKKFSLPLAIGAILLTAAVLIPGIGVRSGGAVRWIDLGFISFQPVEILKYTIIIYYAAWLSYSEPLRENIKYTLLPLIGILAVVGGLLLAQPDTDNFMIIVIVCMLMYFVSGAPWKHILFICLGGLALGGILILNRPYIFDRLTTFMDPTHDPLGSSYQVQQSLIAVGSGQLTGRGFGQSIQKYKYLPEPLSDSIYAVMSEEFGFVGALILILLYISFGLRGYVIAMRSNDIFQRYVVIGIVSLIVFQSLLNIASTIALFPLSGLPLVFVSHGGTALFFACLSVGLVLNISQYQRTVVVPIKRTV
jgi:cell division protein FtsW